MIPKLHQLRKDVYSGKTTKKLAGLYGISEDKVRSLAKFAKLDHVLHSNNVKARRKKVGTRRFYCLLYEDKTQRQLARAFGVSDFRIREKAIELGVVERLKKNGFTARKRIWHRDHKHASKSERKICISLEKKYGVERVIKHLRLIQYEVDFVILREGRKDTGVIPEADDILKVVEYHPWDKEMTLKEYQEKRQALIDEAFGESAIPVIVLKSRNGNI